MSDTLTDEFDKALEESNDFARFIFNTVKDDVLVTLKGIGAKVKDDQIMKLYDSYLSGYLFILKVMALGRYGDETIDTIEETYVHLVKIMVPMSGYLTSPSNLISEYQENTKVWMNEDPMDTPILFTDRLIKDEFKINLLETVIDNYSDYQNRLEKAFDTH